MAGRATMNESRQRRLHAMTGFVGAEAMLRVALFDLARDRSAYGPMRRRSRAEPRPRREMRRHDLVVEGHWLGYLRLFQYAQGRAMRWLRYGCGLGVLGMVWSTMPGC